MLTHAQNAFFSSIILLFGSVAIAVSVDVSKALIYEYDDFIIVRIGSRHFFYIITKATVSPELFRPPLKKVRLGNGTHDHPSLNVYCA